MPEGSITTPVTSPNPTSQPAIDPYQARVGSWLKDKWRLDRLLGVGGMAAVYEATHRNGKRAAIKVLHVQLSIDPEIRARFLREGYVANRVEHPGAVSVLDDDIADDGSFYMVMELLEGETLEDRVKSLGGIDRGDALFIVGRLLEVLAAAHEKGIVHRDIKPENVFLTDEGRVKVLDFGIARLRELSAGGDPAKPGTQTGLAMGTPGFMPPEQARGRWDEVDARSDLWAVGAMLFSLLAGRPVHQAQTVNELLLAAMTTPAPPLSTVLPGASSELCALVDRALAYKKEERFESATAMLEQLKLAQQSLGLPVLVSLALTPRPPELSSPAPQVYSPAAPVSLPDPREALLERRASTHEAISSATTLLASEARPRSSSDDEAPSGSPTSSEPPPARRGGGSAFGLLLLLTLGITAGALFAYPDAPITLQVRSILSPLLLKGARAIAPAPGSDSAGSPAPTEAPTARPVDPAASSPAATATAAPSVTASPSSLASASPSSLPSASAPSSASGSLPSPQASAAATSSSQWSDPPTSAGSAGSASSASSAGSAGSASGASDAPPLSSASHAAKAKVDPNHGKSKPKWQPPPPTKKKTKH